MNKATLAKGLLAVPGVSAGMDILRSSDIGTTIGDLVGTVDGIMEIGNSVINPLFSGVVGGVSAGLLTNSVLKEFGWMEKHEKTRLLLSTIAAGTGYAAGTVAAPYLAAGGLAYAIGKYGASPIYNFGKESVKRLSKSIGNTVTETANSSINLATVPFRSLYNGLVKNIFLKPAPVKAVTNSISN